MEKIFRRKIVQRHIHGIFYPFAIILYSDKMSSAAEEGLRLWLNTVVPSLFSVYGHIVLAHVQDLERKTVLDRLTFGLFGAGHPYGHFPRQRAFRIPRRREDNIRSLFQRSHIKRYGRASFFFLQQSAPFSYCRQ